MTTDETPPRVELREDLEAAGPLPADPPPAPGRAYVDLDGVKARHPSWQPGRKADPPMNEVEVEFRYNRGGRGRRAPYLVISLDALERLVYDHPGIHRSQAAAALIELAADTAQMSGFFEIEAVTEFYDRAEDLSSEENDAPHDHGGEPPAGPAPAPQ